MSAWPPQASYPCGNFSDTSSLISILKTYLAKGSLGHDFSCYVFMIFLILYILHNNLNKNNYTSILFRLKEEYIIIHNIIRFEF